ncbi:unnamed protein product, partial [Choristocarpus tenellus]
IKGAFCLLDKAKILTGPGQPYLTRYRLQTRAITLNNLGCLMKRWGKPRVGIRYLSKAISIEARCQDPDNPAGTHLNMSAALSGIGLHQKAAFHAGAAVDLATEAL